MIYIFNDTMQSTFIFLCTIHQTLPEFFYCPRSERKRARRHLGSPARKRCWNIFPAHRVLFQSREREPSVLFHFKVMLV